MWIKTTPDWFTIGHVVLLAKGLKYMGDIPQTPLRELFIHMAVWISF